MEFQTKIIKGRNPASWNSDRNMDDYVVFEMVFKLVFAVLGLLGNSLVIYAVRTFTFLQTKTYAFVTSLAVADLLLTLGNPVDQGETIRS